MAILKNTTIDDTGFFRFPVGTTAQRPESPEVGMIRYNTDQSQFEVYDGDQESWQSLVDGAAAGVGPQYINLVMGGEIVPPIVGQARFYPPESLIITNIYASISAQATGGDFTFVLRKNGTNTGATLLIPEGSFVMTPVNTNITVNTGDFLTLDITGVGSRDLHVKLEYVLV